MAKKMDLSGVKTFLFNYGERVGLFTCIGIAVLLLIWGVMGASGPGTANGDAWASVIGKGAKGVQQRISGASELDEAQQKDVREKSKGSVPPTEWTLAETKVSAGPYINIAENFDPRRRNPEIMPVMAGDDYFQFDYRFRGHLGYEVTKNTVLAIKGGGAGAGAAGGGNKGLPEGFVPGGGFKPGGSGAGMQSGGEKDEANLARVLKPRHTLVVTGIFPMKKQVDEYVKALRLASISELIAAKELPLVAGINVARWEEGPGVEGKWKELIFWDAEKKKLHVEPVLNQDMIEGIYDRANPKAMASVIHEGLVTPLPLMPDKLHYPEIKIKGDNWPDPATLVAAVESGGPENPMGGKPMDGNFPKGGGSGFKGGGKGILGPKGGGSDQPPGGQMSPEAPEAVPVEQVKLKTLEKGHKELYEKLTGNYNMFHPYGQFPEDAKGAPQGNVERFGFAAQMSGAGGGGGIPGGGGLGTQPGEGVIGGGSKGMKPKGFDPKTGYTGEKGGDKPGATGAGSTGIHDAIVRFVDVDVKPGFSYKYMIQVRMKNPNFGKKDDVVQGAWAAIPELLSNPTETKMVRIPDAYLVFSVDQLQVEKQLMKDPSHFKYAKEVPDANHAVVQIHRWFSRGGTRDEFLVGDWAIAERVYVRKGEPIGGTLKSSTMVVEEPTWNVGRGAFEMQSSAVAKGKVEKGIPLDFFNVTFYSKDGKQITGPPLLVEIAGGKKTNAKIGTSFIPSDEASTELLILTPDGRLIVRDSRQDIEAKIDDLTEAGETRQERVQAWRRRNNSASGAGATQPGGGKGILPGGGGPGGN